MRAFCLFPLLIFLLLQVVVDALMLPGVRVRGDGTCARSSSRLYMQGLQIEADEQRVGMALCSLLEQSYKRTVLEEGKSSFVFCISGGSMLKMLAQQKDVLQQGVIDWSKCTMGFVSHRCVALHDEAATYHKSRPLFLQSWMDQGLKVITPTGTQDAHKEADAYEAALAALPPSVLPRNAKCLPIFDLLLIGVGTDGHVGSIYPNLPDAYSPRIVVPVTKPVDKPAKISLSLAVMAASKAHVVASAGKSSKAPLGKAQAMLKALERDEETAMTFPVSVLRDTALFLIDEDSAKMLTKRTRL